MTTRTPLTDDAWTDLGTTPCFVQSVRFGVLFQAADVAFVIAEAAPASLSADAHELTLGAFDADVGFDGRHVYARALDGRGAVVAVSR